MEGYAGIVTTGNMEIPVDAYLKMVKKQKDREREKQRRGKNNYGFPEEDDNVGDSNFSSYNQSRQQTQYNNYSNDYAYTDDGGYSNQQRPRGDPFGNVSGPKKCSRRSDPFGEQNRYNEEYQQPERPNQQYGSSSSSNAFPRARGNPFESNEQNNQQNYYNGDQQPQMTRGDPFAGQNRQSRFPQAKNSYTRRKDPFARNRGFNDDDDDDY